MRIKSLGNNCLDKYSTPTAKTQCSSAWRVRLGTQLGMLLLCWMQLEPLQLPAAGRLVIEPVKS